MNTEQTRNLIGNRSKNWTLMKEVEKKEEIWMDGWMDAEHQSLFSFLFYIFNTKFLIHIQFNEASCSGREGGEFNCYVVWM